MSAYRAGEFLATDFQAAISSMERLNKYAAEKIFNGNYQISAVTDVTGFGLLGHLSEMVGNEKTAYLNFDSLPLLPGALKYAEEFLSTEGGQRNRNNLQKQVDLSGLTSAAQEILFDPQTSGGLLISLPALEAQALCKEINIDDPYAAVIGEVVEHDKVAIFVV
jgi:selenide,water dikinase